MEICSPTFVSFVLFVLKTPRTQRAQRKLSVEHDYSQLFFAGFVLGPFGFLYALLLDGAVRDGGFMFVVIDDTCLGHSSVCHHVHFHTNLTFLVYRGVDLLDQSTTACTIANTAAGAAAIARSKAGAITRADAGAGTAAGATAALAALEDGALVNLGLRRLRGRSARLFRMSYGWSLLSVLCGIVRGCRIRYFLRGGSIHAAATATTGRSIQFHIECLFRRWGCHY